MQVELVTFNPVNSVSGIGRYVRELYAHLSHRIPVRLVGNIDPPFSDRLTFLRSFSLGLRDHQPGNIVHFTQIMGCAQMLWRPVRPAIATVHDLGVLVCKEDELLFNRFDRWILDLQLAGLKRMDYLIAVSNFTGRGLVDVLGIPHSRVRVVHSGVDRNLFQPITGARTLLAEQHDINFAAGIQNLLYVGNEQPRKNLGVLLKALSTLKVQGHKLRLIKVGGAGGERWRQRFLEEIKVLQVDGDVLIVDSVSDTDLALFYCAADLYVTPSLLEGFGLPVIEAMACGTPVVCSRAGSLPEIAGDAAILVEAMDADALAAAIARVLEDTQLRRQMTERGLARAAMFTWTSTAEQLVRFYQKFRR